MTFCSRRILGIIVPILLLAASLNIPAVKAADNTVNVTLSEYKINMPTSLPAGPTTFKVTNSGNKKHTFKIEGSGIEEKLKSDLKENESGMLRVDLKPGTYKVTCPVMDHTEKGMTLELTVQ